MSDHTPGPWTIEWVEDSMFDPGAMEGVAEIKHDTEDGRAEEVLAAVFGYRDLAMRDARFIVRACNSHEELLGALKTCADHIASSSDLMSDDPMVKQARAAIAKARGTP